MANTRATTVTTVPVQEDNVTATSAVEPEGLFSSAEPETEDAAPEPVTLADMLSEEGVAFVDNSGSTSGSILTNMQHFTVGLAPQQTALWNSTCNILAPTDAVRWASTGGTAPSSIYRHYNDVPSSWSSFTLLTDGCVPTSEVTFLSQQAHKTSHLPTILGIALGSDNRLVNSCNVSVLFAHFTAARTAVLLTISITKELRVIKAKGDWETAFGVLPDLTDTAMLFDYPTTSLQALRALQACRSAQQPRHTVLLQGSGCGARWLHLEKLLSIPDATVLEGQVTEEEMEDVVRIFHGQGRLTELRKWLSDLSSAMAAEAQRAVSAAAPAAAEGGPAVSITTILSRLRNTQDQAEREKLRMQLFSKAQGESEAKAAAAKEAKKANKSARQLVDGALRAACALEKAGMGAQALGRLSNRAMRAKQIDHSILKPMSELDASGAPTAECNVMLDDGPVALLLRRVPPEMTEENTADFALDFPLCIGCAQRNDIFCPDVVGLSNSTADQIEAAQESVLGRECTVVALPIVTLSLQENRNELFKRLCLAFNNGLQLGAVWQVALASILNALENKSWAAAGTTVGKLLGFLGAEIMSNILLMQGTRLALDGDRLMNDAFAQSLATEDFIQHYPIEGTVTAAAALIRWGAPTTASDSTYTACVLARAHRAVAQQYRSWLQSHRPDGLPCSTTALWHAIFDLRHGGNSGQLAPIAGTHHLPLSWAGVLADETRLSLDRYARILAITQQREPCSAGADSLITPGLALVIRGTLAQITNPHISAAAAIEQAQLFHSAVAAEFTPATVGSTTSDDAHAILAEWLLWARCPMRPVAPFATPYSPSLIYFYHGRTHGGTVTNMTEGFQWNIDIAGECESEESRMNRLAEHVKAVRGLLLQREYQYNFDGSHGAQTVSLPIHRCMSDEWGENPTPDPSHGSFVSAVVERLVTHNKGNIYLECLEHGIAMLCTSLLQVGRPSQAGEFHDFRKVAPRLQLELAGRTTAQVRVEDAPPAIWVPRENPELQARLREAEEATNARMATARAAALARAAAMPKSDRAQAAGPVKKLVGEGLGRSVTKILRHTAVARGLKMRPDGYVEVEKLLELEGFEGVAVDELLEQVIEVELTQKRRHQVIEEDGVLLLRAVQGHSMPLVCAEALLVAIIDASEVPVCIHGTYEKAWEKIKDSELDKMSRNEIQMAVGLFEDADVVSGVRQNVEVIIYIDVGRAMAQGIRFFRSPNNVICSPGPIPPSCFTHVARRRDGTSLMEPAFRRTTSRADAGSVPNASNPNTDAQPNSTSRNAKVNATGADAA